MVVPAGWKEVCLGDLGLFSKGAGIKRDDIVLTGVPCVRYGQLYTEHDSVIRSIRSFVSTEVASTSRPLVAGEILFAGSGETKAEIGKCVAYVDEIGAVAGGDLVILTPKQCSSIFLGYALNSPEVVRQKTARAQGDAVVHISAASLATVVVGLPPLKEQKAIAETLSDADTAIESLDTLITKKRDVKQAAMQQLLTGRTRLPGFSADWKEVRFDEVFARVNISNRKLQTSEYSDIGRLPVMDQGQTRIAGFTDRQDIELIPPRDGFVIFGDHTRIVKHVRHPFVAGADGVQILRSCEGFNAEFLSLLLSSSRIPNTGYNRHFKFLKELVFKVPSGLVEQEAIAEALSVMGDELDALTEQVSKLRMVKEGMMQDLLTGKVRLV